MDMSKGYTVLYQEAFDLVLMQQRQLYGADLESRCFSKKNFGGKTNKLTNFNFVFITSTQLSGIENMLVSFSAFQIFFPVKKVVNVKRKFLPRTFPNEIIYFLIENMFPKI